MPFDKDLLVLLLIVFIAIVWTIFQIKKWFNKSSIPLHEAKPPEGKAVAILKKHGYKVMAGKLIVPVHIKIDESPSELSSRVYIDYIVSKDQEDYIVLLAKHRHHVNWKAGSSVRDYFFHYSLMYDKIKGIIYVDLSNNTIKKITFEW
ncbi:hypothetical protein [Chengkuizengella axinellae]|uniref:Uncharacterized protein n=1 Tax=Chengkuizengella axinellae TaxID=3064388 RepID=A0ABT9IWB8_9BACL|nr:hypothetical protein [Chengkuizengella sp. 2205SS18-9]MDP5273612.1 hypothetical protein [Chengkuizengella sp. 2205SS18-9]